MKSTVKSFFFSCIIWFKMLDFLSFWFSSDYSPPLVTVCQLVTVDVFTSFCRFWVWSGLISAANCLAQHLEWGGYLINIYLVSTYSWLLRKSLIQASYVSFKLLCLQTYMSLTVWSYIWGHLLVSSALKWLNCWRFSLVP